MLLKKRSEVRSVLEGSSSYLLPRAKRGVKESLNVRALTRMTRSRLDFSSSTRMFGAQESHSLGLS